MSPEVRHYTTLYRRQRPDQPILTCYWDARRTVHFRETLAADIKAHKKRSKAAKKAWKTRKANQQKKEG